MATLSAAALSGFLAPLKACSAFDFEVIVYGFLVALIILSYRWGGGNSYNGRRKGKHKFHAPKLSPPPSSRLAGDANWKKQFEGTLINGIASLTPQFSDYPLPFV